MSLASEMRSQRTSHSNVWGFKGPSVLKFIWEVHASTTKMHDKIANNCITGWNHNKGRLNKEQIRKFGKGLVEYYVKKGM